MQAAGIKRRIAGHLQRGETVTEALKRLRPPPARGARKRARPHLGTIIIMSTTIISDCYDDHQCHNSCMIIVSIIAVSVMIVSVIMMHQRLMMRTHLAQSIRVGIAVGC
jgi:hypothetical protein